MVNQNVADLSSLLELKVSLLGMYKVPYFPPLGGGGVYQVYWGRISCLEEGKKRKLSSSL